MSTSEGTFSPARRVDAICRFGGVILLPRANDEAR